MLKTRTHQKTTGSLIRMLVATTLLASTLLPAVARSETIDYLLLYDSYTKNYYRGEVRTVMRNWVDQVNRFYRNSNIDLTLRLVGVYEYNLVQGDYGSLLNALRSNEWINQKRDELGADFVTQVHRTLSCGVGYVAVNDKFAFNLVGTKCGPQTMAHELGHNMGLNHSRKQGSDGGSRYRYGLGHGVNGLFGTIMTYHWLFNGAEVPYFSNPRIQCKGEPCGVPEGDPREADAVKAINNVRQELAAFRPTANSGGGSDPVVPPGKLADGTYLMQAMHSRKCIEVVAASTDQEARLHQWSCHQADNQRWIFKHLGEERYEVRAKHSALCMSAREDQRRGIVQLSCDGRLSQQWRLSDALGGYRLRSLHNQEIAQVERNTSENGVLLKYDEWNNEKRQAFLLQRLE